MHRIDLSVPLFFTRVRGTRIPVTPQLVVDVLRVPRIDFLDYPSCECLRTVSRNELMSSFCKRPTAWGERLFTPCRPFATGLRFMNMVMTFVLHPLSHYNSITEPRARFLLSFLEHFTIDFPSHFILSIIDVHLDSASRDKLIMVQLQHMDARLDTLSIELYQVDVHVDHIARRQVTMGGFAPKPTPSPPHPVASDSDAEDDDDNDGDGDDDDASDDDGDASSTDEIST